MHFLAKYGLDILGGILVMLVFLRVKQWSFDEEPKTRGDGTSYNTKRAQAGPENDWKSTIVENDAA